MPYVVTSPITHLGRSYAVGEAIEPKAQLLGQLLAAGCIKEVPPPVPVEKPGRQVPFHRSGTHVVTPVVRD